MKKRAVVICPGRGSYSKETLGYLQQFGGEVEDFLKATDTRRRLLNEPTLSELDGAATFKPALHTKGEHASPLIYACAFADFMAIDRDKFDVVAITGNSMGWYLALAFAGSLDADGGFDVINTMGSMMKDEIIGGQVLYPVCDEHWVLKAEKLETVARVLKELNLRPGVAVYLSIRLGGYVVLGANKLGLSALLKELPAQENYPFQLLNHAAFHTPLLRETSARAFELLPSSLFHPPKIPLIDGRGCVWQPYSTATADLYHYTLGHQVVEPFDFTQALSVALKEFAPDHLILLGPGSSLGGSIGQILIQNDWYGLKSKAEFSARQTQAPLLLAMGRADQRPSVVK